MSRVTTRLYSLWGDHMGAPLQLANARYLQYAGVLYIWGLPMRVAHTARECGYPCGIRRILLICHNTSPFPLIIAIILLITLDRMT